MKIFIQIIFSLSLLCLICIPLMAQDVEPTATSFDVDALRSGEINAFFSTSNEAPLIGEPFNLTLEVFAPASYEITIPDLPDMSPLEIVTSSSITNELRENQSVYQRQFQVIIWETGTYLSPEIAVNVADANGVTFLAPVDSFFVNVPATVEDPANQSLRPFMPPIRLPESESQLFLVIILGIAFSFMGLILWSLQRRNHRQDISRATATTRVKIQDLREADLDLREKFNLLAVIIREFLVNRLMLDAMEMTTSEIIASLNAKGDINKNQVSQLRQILEQCDVVKFTKIMPDESVTNQYIDFSLRWVTEVDQSIKRRTADD